jgi:hypothetical protein
LPIVGIGHLTIGIGRCRLPAFIGRLLHSIIYSINFEELPHRTFIEIRSHLLVLNHRRRYADEKMNKHCVPSVSGKGVVLFVLVIGEVSIQEIINRYRPIVWRR